MKQRWRCFVSFWYIHSRSETCLSGDLKVGSFSLDKTSFIAPIAKISTIVYHVFAMYSQGQTCSSSSETCQT